MSALSMFSGAGSAADRELALALFAGSDTGAWYDPSDLTTLFQDSAGTTPVTAMEQPVGLMRDKSGNGYHAVQATATKRPVVSRRVNLLTNTNALTAPPWLASESTITLAAEPTPLGNSQVFKLAENNINKLHRLEYTSAGATAGTAYKLDFLVKPAGRTQCQIFEDSGSGSAIFDLVAGTYSAVAAGTTPEIKPAGGGWWRVSIVYQQTGTISRARIATVYSGATVYTGDGVSGILVCAPSLTVATDAHLPYQRVNTATDYDADPNKFPTPLHSDGVDDALTGATGGGGTTGFFFASAVLTTLAGAKQVLWSDAGINTGYEVGINAANKLQLSVGTGSTRAVVESAALTANTRYVLSAWHDGANIYVRLNTNPPVSANCGAATAGTAGITMFCENGASAGYFRGRSYGHVYRKNTVPGPAVMDALLAHLARKSGGAL